MGPAVFLQRFCFFERYDPCYLIGIACFFKMCWYFYFIEYSKFHLFVTIWSANCEILLVKSPLKIDPRWCSGYSDIRVQQSLVFYMDRDHGISYLFSSSCSKVQSAIDLYFSKPSFHARFSFALTDWISILFVERMNVSCWSGASRLVVSGFRNG